jgi:tetratricopeptide (TPR) repeat protein
VIADQTTPFGFHAARPYYRLGEYRRAVEATRAEIDMFRGERLYSRSRGVLSSLRARLWLILSLVELGEFPEAQQVSNEMFELADATRDRTDHLFACAGTGRLSLVKGDFAKVIATLERVPFRRKGDDLTRQLHSRMAALLGLAYVVSGRTTQGLELLKEGVSVGASVRFIYGESLGLASLAEGYLLSGGIQEAERSAAQALEFARNHGHCGWEAWTLRLHGEIARHRGELELAAAFYRDAMSLAQERGMRPLLAHCHRGLAALPNQERSRASQHMITAMTMYREMDMRFWLAGVEARTGA